MTVRIAQTELGQGVWTSNAMIVCEELQCDWSKVRPQYASANRDAKEMAPDWTLNVPGNGGTDPNGGGEPTFGNRARTGVQGIPDSVYRRMRTNAASSVKDGRYYLQLAGAEARERLLLAAANDWGVPVAELTAKDSVITSREERPHDHLRQDRAPRRANAASASRQRSRSSRRDQWTLMGTEQKNLDVPMKVTGETVYAIDVKLPGMKWAAVRSCPVYGGDVKSYDFDAVREHARRALGRAVPDPRSRAHARPRVQRRRGGDRRSLVSGEDRARPDADRVGRSRRGKARSTRRTCARRSPPRSTSRARCA